MNKLKVILIFFGVFILITASWVLFVAKTLHFNIANQSSDNKALQVEVWLDEEKVIDKLVDPDQVALPDGTTYSKEGATNVFFAFRRKRFKSYRVKVRINKGEVIASKQIRTRFFSFVEIVVVSDKISPSVHRVIIEESKL